MSYVNDLLAARSAARLEKRVRDDALLEVHRKLAHRLGAGAEANRLRQKAEEQVARWESARLCHPRYVNEWRGLLRGPLAQLRAAMVRDDADGVALRQNSPFGFAVGKT